MLRVGDLQRSIDFYTNVLGMQLLRSSENPEYKYSLAFVGYEGNPAQAEIELTYNWGTTSYELGTAYGHIALGVPDAYAACEKIKAAGGQVTREAGPVKGGTTVIAFVTDPDGYKIELIQRASEAAGGGLRYFDSAHRTLGGRCSLIWLEFSDQASAGTSAADTSRWVYGCCGASSTWLTEPISTTAPSFITSTWCAIARMTSTSWVISR